MSDHDKQMASRLRLEAQRERPLFSHALHDRIMDSVSTTSVQPVRRTQSLRQIGTLLSSAALVLVAVGSFALLSRSANDTPVDRESGTASKSAAAPALAHAEPGPTAEPIAAAQPAVSLEATSEIYAAAVRHLEVFEHAQVMPETKLMEEQIALLDHDARVAAGWLLDPLAVAFNAN